MEEELAALNKRLEGLEKALQQLSNPVVQPLQQPDESDSDDESQKSSQARHRDHQDEELMATKIPSEEKLPEDLGNNWHLLSHQYAQLGPMFKIIKKNAAVKTFTLPEGVSNTKDPVGPKFRDYRAELDSINNQFKIFQTLLRVIMMEVKQEQPSYQDIIAIVLYGMQTLLERKSLIYIEGSHGRGISAEYQNLLNNQYLPGEKVQVLNRAIKLQNLKAMGYNKNQPQNPKPREGISTGRYSSQKRTFNSGGSKPGPIQKKVNQFSTNTNEGVGNNQ